MKVVVSFFLYSVAGWVYEVVLGFLYGDGFVNRGFLSGPYLPIYGFGAVLLVILLKPLTAGKWKPHDAFVEMAVVFLLIAAMTTVIEYVASWGLEALFHQRWWDYSEYAFHLNGRICLSASLRFGVGGMIFLYIFQPFFDRMYLKMKKWQRVLSAAVILLVMLFDLTGSMAKMIGI